MVTGPGTTALLVVWALAAGEDMSARCTAATSRCGSAADEGRGDPCDATTSCTATTAPVTMASTPSQRMTSTRAGGRRRYRRPWVLPSKGAVIRSRLAPAPHVAGSVVVSWRRPSIWHEGLCGPSRGVDLLRETLVDPAQPQRDRAPALASSTVKNPLFGGDKAPT